MNYSLKEVKKTLTEQGVTLKELVGTIGGSKTYYLFSKEGVRIGGLWTKTMLYKEFIES